MKHEQKIWMAVTADDLELPIAVADSAPQLAQMLGIKRASIYEKMSRDKKRAKHKGRNDEYKIVTVKM